jgi:hypothetical protein
VTLFKREKHLTSSWNPLHFAIYKKDLSLVKQILNNSQENPRLVSRLDYGAIDDVEGDVFPLILAASNQDLNMFKYFWEMHYLWNWLHLSTILQIIFLKTSWKAGVSYLFESQVTQDIYFSMNFTT